MAETIDVVFPVHNEGGTIAGTLREFHRRAAVEEGRALRFVVCEDGSTDGTVAALEALKNELPLLLVRSAERKGYPRAVLDGLRASRGEVVVVADSDGQCDPADLSRLLAAVEGADLAVGVRRPRADPWARRLMSGAFGLVHRALFGAPLRDPSCPFVAVRRGLLDRLLAGPFGRLPHGFWWEFAARAAAAGARLRETAIHHRPRASGATRVFTPARVPAIACRNLAGLLRLAFELGVPERGRWAALAALALATTFLLWPALNQPLILDDIDILGINKMLAEVMEWGAWSRTWQAVELMVRRCTLPFYFRPLNIPLFFLWHFIADDSPFVMRAFMLALHVAAAVAVFRFARDASEDEGTAYFAAGFYALSWIHWDTLWNVVNVGQSVSDLLFWTLLRVSLRPGESLRTTLALLTAAVFFKDSAVMFPAFALLSQALLVGPRSGLPARAGLYGAWTAAYLGARFFLLPGDPSNPGLNYAWRWPGAQGLLDFYRAAWELLVLPLRGRPAGGAFPCLWAPGADGRAEAAAWALAVAAFCAVLGWAAWSLVRAAPRAPSPRRAAGLVALGAAGFVLGIVPYLFIHGFLSWGWAHRVTLSCGALALCFGVAASALARAASRLDRRAGLLACLAVMGSLFAGQAIYIRQQDPGLPPFDGMVMSKETSMTARFFHEKLAPELRNGQSIAFEGFHQSQRVSPMLRALERKWFRHAAPGDVRADWTVRRVEADGKVTLSVRRLGGEEATVTWSHPTVCAPARGWDLAPPY